MQRNEKLQEALREAAAEFFAREANRNTLLTVTRVQVSEKGNSALIYISVYPEQGEQSALAFANRNTREFAEFASTRIRGMRVPYVSFVIDEGEKNRRRLDELS